MIRNGEISCFKLRNLYEDSTGGEKLSCLFDNVEFISVILSDQQDGNIWSLG